MGSGGISSVHWLACEFGDKWSLPILCELGVGPLRFLQLKRALGSISQRMLTRTLKKLERAGVVIRASSGGAGMQVIYALTDGGAEMLEAFRGLSFWLREHGYVVDNRQDAA
jgi:DNA-binding HxlR family transcriptional regulator